MKNKPLNVGNDLDKTNRESGEIISVSDFPINGVDKQFPFQYVNMIRK